MIKVISLDIGGTILFTENINKYGFNELAIITNKPYEEVKKCYKEIFQKQKGTLEELTMMFCNKLKIEINNEILNFFKEKFNEVNNVVTLNNIVMEFIYKLKQKNLKIILFSNSCCLMKNSLDASFISQFDDIFYSYDLGYSKEDKESYRIIEEKMGYKPDEFLHVGDTLTSDYLYPKKYGWNALYYGKNSDDLVESIITLDEVFNY